MKLTCLSYGSGTYYPPCYMLELCGFRLLLECPVDFSALHVFSHIGVRQQLEQSSFIKAVPWYKAPKKLHLWDVSLIDVVLISSPAGMLGLPFLSRNPRFSAKVYASEATARIGRLMMEDLVSMHSEFIQIYGQDDRTSFPDWMAFEELERLPLKMKEIVIGEDGEDLGCWLPLYSVADINGCIEKVHPLKFAEEACYNSTITLKAFSSGLEIGSCNWIINAPRRNLVYLSCSIFESAHAMDFDYHPLQGADIILFSDMSSLNNIEEDYSPVKGSKNEVKIHDVDTIRESSSIPRDFCADDAEVANLLRDGFDISEEKEKFSFISSCIMDSVMEGGSVLIPIGRLGIVLQLLEHISHILDSCGLTVPIFFVSTTAEEILTFANSIPEWLCNKRREKLFCGEPLFGHAELLKEKKLHVFSQLYSSNLLMMWQEPCIVFTPHWSLRFGSVVHLLDRWHHDHRCLLILEHGMDAELALSPFKTVVIRVLQCYFLSGIRTHKIHPLLCMLKPKLVLFPEDFKPLCASLGNCHFTFLFYSVNSTLDVPKLRDDFEGLLTTDLALRLQPKRLTSKDMAIARLSGKPILSKGKYVLIPSKQPIDLSSKRIFWGSVDAVRLLVALKEKGMDGSIERDGNAASENEADFIRIKLSNGAVIECSGSKTLICSGDEAMASKIYEAICSICDGI